MIQLCSMSICVFQGCLTRITRAQSTSMSFLRCGNMWLTGRVVFVALIATTLAPSMATNWRRLSQHLVNILLLKCHSKYCSWIQTFQPSWNLCACAWMHAYAMYQGWFFDGLMDVMSKTRLLTFWPQKLKFCCRGTIALNTEYKLDYLFQFWNYNLAQNHAYTHWHVI